MSRQLSKLGSQATSPRVLAVVAIGVTVAGIVVWAEARRRRRESREDFGAFVERFELLPSPQPPPPAAKQPLADLTFAIQDIFDVKDHVTGFGNPDWGRTHKAAEKTAVAVAALLKGGATCNGKTVMDELAFGIAGQNVHYGTPTNPQLPSHVPGGSSSGSAVAVAAKLVDFALGCDTIGGIRIPASFCGILGYRPSHGSVSTMGVLPNSPSLDTVDDGMFSGWLARDPAVLHCVGHVLLSLNAVEPRRERRLIFADDLFQFWKVPKQKTEDVISKVIESLSGYQPAKHLNFGQYIASKVPSLRGLCEESPKIQNGTPTLKALSSVMASLQRYEFRIKHEDWVVSVKPKLGPDVSDHVLAATKSIDENVKVLYKIRTDIRAALQSLLRDDKVLVIPTIADPPSKLTAKRKSLAESHDRALILSSIASMSGCCQAAIPLGEHDGYPISVSFITFHGGDKFLLDTVLDMYSSLQEQVRIASNSALLPDITANMEASELLKEKGNAAFKGKQFNKAVKYYTEAIKLNESNATYYSNRAAAYLELACFQQADEDCSKAILLDKKNVKAFLRRGTARESMLCYRESAQDFRHALVLEPQNKAASLALKRLAKLMN